MLWSSSMWLTLLGRSSPYLLRDARAPGLVLQCCIVELIPMNDLFAMVDSWILSQLVGCAVVCMSLVL